MRKLSFIILVFIAFSFFFSTNTLSQGISNRGKEFWVTYAFNSWFINNDGPPVGGIPANSQEMRLYISSIKAATVTVSINNTGWSQVLNLPANTVDASILIPKTGINDARVITDGTSSKGIHIVSNEDIAVYAHQYMTANSGATMLMPVESYGYLYTSVNFSQATSNSKLPSIANTVTNGNDWYSWFYCIASEDNTRLEITPSDTTKNGWLPGQTYIVNLNKGESYHVFGKLIAGGSQSWQASKDMTGSKVISVPGADGSCHPFALFSGSGGIRFCYADGGEYMQQQVFPVQAWGTNYLTYHTINNLNSDLLETNRNYYRVCVLDPTTVVKRNGITLTALIKNFYYEFVDSVGGDYITSDKPIMVAQYCVNKNQCWVEPRTPPSIPPYGDPEMLYISPIEQGQKEVSFYASRYTTGIAVVYTNIYLPTNAVNSLKIDGVPPPATQVIPHPNNPNYSVALVKYPGAAAQHTITCDSNFTAFIYGLGLTESYGYNIGTNVNNLNNFSAIKNTFNTSGNIDTFTCPKTPVRLFVKLGYLATSITWKLSQLSGITPNIDSIIINPIPAGTEIINGRTYYVYTLQQDFTFVNNGTFYLPVTYTTAVSSNCSRAGDMSVKIVVKPGPISNFTISGVGCLTDTVLFTNSAITNGFNINTYLWNFDDGSTQNTPNAKKRFLTFGIQNVRYRIYADNGCAGDTTKPVTIIPIPTAKLGLPSSACVNESVAVTDTSIANTGTIINWRYDFGDGTVVANNNGNSFTHQYQNPGTYVAKLVVYTATCKSDTSYKTIFISPGPITKFGFDKNICLGDSIRFTDSSTVTTGAITGWRWSFGDGSPAVTYNNGAAFFYKYAAVGVYTVTLQTTSSNGCTGTYSLNVSVNNKPTALATATGKPCIDSSYIFTSSLAYNSNNPAIWYWNFGDAQTATITNAATATHAYNNTLSNITVKHVAGYGPGCMSDTATLIIPLINPNPAAVPFTVSALSPCALIPVQFSATVPAGITQWLWNFGDGTGNQVPPFSRAYSTANNYTVTLKVLSAAGCGSATSSNNIIVLPAPTVNAGADKLISTGSSISMTASITGSGNYSYLWSPTTGLSSTSILNPVASPQATTTYSLAVTDNANSCTATDSVKITVISKLYIPNAFTPNGDGKNDRWSIPAMVLYPDAVVTIFNRYGQKIFETKNYSLNAWDGTYKGTTQPMGSYIYVIQFAADKFQNGTVTIVR